MVLRELFLHLPMLKTCFGLMEKLPLSFVVDATNMLFQSGIPEGAVSMTSNLDSRLYIFWTQKT